MALFGFGHSELVAALQQECAHSGWQRPRHKAAIPGRSSPETGRLQHRKSSHGSGTPQAVQARVLQLRRVPLRQVGSSWQQEGLNTEPIKVI